MKKNTVRDNRPYVRPVERIELDESHLKGRFILFAALILIAAVSILYGIINLTRASAGWTEIKVETSSQINCGDDFTFIYDLGRGELSPTAEKKQLTVLYSSACEEAYRQFDVIDIYDGVNNVAYLNQHINEIVTVDDVLYDAFRQINEHDSRYLFLGPVYERYDYVFFYHTDEDIADYDPNVNETVHQEYLDILAYACDPECISIELFEGNRVRLNVSDDYRKYMEDNSYRNYIDFYWMKNAFIVDYLAERLISSGFTSGSISSDDGFSICLDDSGLDYRYNIYDYVDEACYQAAVFNYSGRMHIVTLKDFPMYQDDRYYNAAGTGKILTPYLSVIDALNRSRFRTMTCYDRSMNCAGLLLEMAPYYLCDQDDFLTEGFDCFYIEDSQIFYSDQSVPFSDLYRTYTLKPITK
ncbi:MAG: hypothetical protein J5365_00550 [Erysipelotrichaceae bacterium]|nr:hypothetical protein [Erysipelotrichaceae bacterium]